MVPDDTAELPRGEEQPDECQRAPGCPGWLVTREGFVRQCEACAAFSQESDAHWSARAAGLDVQQNGFVIGVPGVGRPREPQSEARRATVSANARIERISSRFCAAPAASRCAQVSCSSSSTSAELRV